MLRPFRVLLHLRWAWLVYTLPPTLLWARAFPYAGAMIVVSHALLVLLHGVLCDTDTHSTRRLERLTVLGPRICLRREPLAPAAGFLAFGVLGSGLVLIVAEWRAAALTFASLALVLTTTRLARALGKWRGRFNEIVRPVVSLALPAWALKDIASSRQIAEMRQITGEGQIVELPGLMSGSAVGATVLWSVLMGVFILLCLTRDEADDRTAGIATTPTILGPRRAAVVAMLWSGLAMLVAAWGAFHHHWGWVTGGFAGLGAIAAAWSAGAGRISNAPLLWTLATIIASLGLMRGW